MKPIKKGPNGIMCRIIVVNSELLSLRRNILLAHRNHSISIYPVVPHLEKPVQTV